MCAYLFTKCTNGFRRVQKKKNIEKHECLTTFEQRLFSSARLDANINGKRLSEQKKIHFGRGRSISYFNFEKNVHHQIKS